MCSYYCILFHNTCSGFAKMKKSKRDEILSQALTVLYDNPHASMSDIAGKINISRATLYRHFETREALVVEIYANNHKKFMAILAPILSEPISAKEKCIKFFRLYIPFSLMNEFIMHNQFYVNYKEGREAYEEKKDVMRELIRQMKEEGDIDKSLSDEWMTVLFKNLVRTSWEVVKSGYAGVNSVVENIEHLLFRSK